MEDDSANIVLYVQNFILIRHILYSYSEELQAHGKPEFDIPINKGEIEDWKEGKRLNPIPISRRY